MAAALSSRTVKIVGSLPERIALQSVLFPSARRKSRAATATVMPSKTPAKAFFLNHSYVYGGLPL